jgi:hypothetical protein
MGPRPGNENVRIGWRIGWAPSSFRPTYTSLRTAAGFREADS